MHHVITQFSGPLKLQLGIVIRYEHCKYYTLSIKDDQNRSRYTSIGWLGSISILLMCNELENDMSVARLSTYEKKEITYH